MPQTLLQIANAALVKIGSPSITSLDQSVKHAEVCNTIIRTLRDQLLRSYMWSFAKTYASLTPAATPIGVWTHSIALPSDCIRVLGIYNSTTNARITAYEIGGVDADSQKLLIGSANVVIIKYIAQPADGNEATHVFPDDFAQALACLLASEISTALFDSPERRDAWLAQYISTIRLARFCNTVEQPSASMPSAEWIAARQFLMSSDFWAAQTDPMSGSSQQGGQQGN